MKYTMYVENQDQESLQYDVISQEFRIYLTRLLEKRLPKDENLIIYQNIIINHSRRLANLSPYVLDSADENYYYPAEHAWHNGEFDLIFRRLDTIQFAEFLCELIESERFECDEINDLLSKENLSFRIAYNNDENLYVKSIALEQLESDVEQRSHPNILVLIRRMERAMSDSDYANVLLASAQIFETMAKDIVGTPEVQNITLAQFFTDYRAHSNLPEEILDYILSIYRLRNVTPLAGHGSTATPEISRESAIALSEITKAFVKIEYLLRFEPVAVKSSS